MSDRVQEARVALDGVYEASAMGEYDVDRYCETRDAYAAAVRSATLAEVRRAAGKWYAEARSYTLTDTELAMLNSCEANTLAALDRMEATDGHE